MKEPTPKATAARNLLVVLVCATNMLLLAYFMKQQIKIEKYGRAAATQQPSASSVATVEKTTGKVLVLRKGALDEKRIKDNSSLYGGDRIQTSRRSRATIVMEDRTRLKMGADSLLVIPEPDKEETAGEPVSILHLTEGTMEIDSETIGEHVVALRTPNALIKLNMRDIVVFHPGDSERWIKHGIPYLLFLKDHWAARGGVTSGEYAAASVEYAAADALIGDAVDICEAAERKACSDAKYKSWEGVRRYRKKVIEQQRLKMTVSIEADGKENIEVKGGAVRIETSNRTLTLAEGDTLELEEGVIPTQPNLTESAVQSLVMHETEVFEEGEEVFPQIESMWWQ